MARLRRRTRRTNPLRPIGALLINPRGRRHRKSRKHRNPELTASARKFPVAVAGYTHTVGAYRRRKAPKAKRNPSRSFRALLGRRLGARRSFRRKMGARRNPLFLKTNPRRRRSRRNPLFMRTNPLFLKTNPHGKRHRKHRRKARKNGILGMFKRNPASGLSKIPVIGPLLASTFGFVPSAAIGAVSVEPVMFVTQMVAPYLPAAMPFSLTVAVAGLVMGAVIKRYMPGVSQTTRDSLAIATASAAGGVAYWLWRTGDDAPVKEKMGALIVAGYGSPFAGAIMGDANLGSLITSSPSYGAPVYGDMAPMTVTPMGNYAPLGGSVYM